ncbi:kinase suppressor of Ras 2 [Tulasnella sp. 403]|nr:kinase suppressor of Ras 2 [Tulasnella sp. 403]
MAGIPLDVPERLKLVRLAWHICTFYHATDAPITGEGHSIGSGLFTWADSTNGSRESDIASLEDFKATITPPPTSYPKVLPLHKGVTAASTSVPDISSVIRKASADPLGVGGYYEIFLGHHETEGEMALRCMQLRLIRQSKQRAFWREVELWYQLDHKNINRLLGTFTDQRSIYMVSPWISNGSVWACITTGRPFDHTKVLFGIASAVEYLHSLDIVHGDLKLDNVLLSQDGNALLTDFGLSKRLEYYVTSVSDPSSVGSFPWLAPEVLNGSDRSKASDAYAFGMIIAEMLTRKRPYYTRPHLGNVLISIMSGVRPSVEDIDVARAPGCYLELWDMASDCWVEAPEQRPPVQDVMSHLRLLH